jgi:hypothetical protein
VCVCVFLCYIYIFNLLTCNLRAGKIVSVLEGGYGELKEQGGKWVFDREVIAATAIAIAICIACTTVAIIIRFGPTNQPTNQLTN